MELKEATKQLNKTKEIFEHLKYHGWINDIKKDVDASDVIEAIDTVLEALEITQAKEEVAFEQGYRKGKDKGQQEGLQCGYGMGLQVKLRGEENGII